MDENDSLIFDLIIYGHILIVLLLMYWYTLSFSSFCTAQFFCYFFICFINFKGMQQDSDPNTYLEYKFFCLFVFKSFKLKHDMYPK